MRPRPRAPRNPAQNVFLGSRIQENVWYALFLDVCYNGDTGHIEALGHVGNTAGNPGLDQGFVIDQDWPAGISTFGQFGIAGWAKSSLANSSVRAFNWSTDGE